MQEPLAKDWVSTVREDLEDLEIKMTFNEIEETGPRNFTKLCKSKVITKAFEYLQNKKLNHDKVRHVEYKNLEMANYLKSIESEYSIENRQYLFQCRVNDIQARANRPWQHEETHCISCNHVKILILKKQENIFWSAMY